MIHWLTTAPNPKVPAWSTPDAGQRGWRLHAIEAPEKANFRDVRSERAACGLRPAHGWGLDLFIEDENRCRRCEKALGLSPSHMNVNRNRIATEMREQGGKI